MILSTSLFRRLSRTASTLHSRCHRAPIRILVCFVNNGTVVRVSKRWRRKRRRPSYLLYGASCRLHLSKRFLGNLKLNFNSISSLKMTVYTLELASEELKPVKYILKLKRTYFGFNYASPPKKIKH